MEENSIVFRSGKIYAGRLEEKITICIFLKSEVIGLKSYSDLMSFYNTLDSNDVGRFYRKNLTLGYHMLDNRYFFKFKGNKLALSYNFKYRINYKIFNNQQPKSIISKFLNYLGEKFNILYI